MHPLLHLNQKTYNAIAPKFAQTRQKPLWPEVVDFKKFVKPYQKILDVGCGSGRLLSLLKDIHIKYTGVDSSEKLLALAGNRTDRTDKPDKANKAEFLKADVLSLPLKADSQDIVFCLAVLHHLPTLNYRQQALAEMHRVLKSEGLLLMTNWNLWRLSWKKKTWWKYKVKSKMLKVKSASQKLKVRLYLKDVITWWQADGQKYSLYYHSFTLKELKSLLQQAGFKILKNQYSLNNQKAHWYNGRNIVSIAKKS